MKEAIVWYRNGTTDFFVVATESSSEVNGQELVERIKVKGHVDGRTVYWMDTERGHMKHKFKTPANAIQFSKELFGKDTIKDVIVYKKAVSAGKLVKDIENTGDRELYAKYVK